MANSFQYWDSGFPVTLTDPPATITFQYWDNGFPATYVSASSGSPPAPPSNTTRIYAFILS